MTRTLKKAFWILMVVIFMTSFGDFVRAQSMDTSTGSIGVSVQKQVKAIEIQGNKTISIATVLSKIKTRVGQNYLQSVISDDLKRLYNTGYFSDVRVDREEHEGGFKVVIFVEEKPIVEDITFSKTRHLRSRSLFKNLKTQVGKFLDKKALRDDTDTIKALYFQKGLTKVEVEVESFIDEVTNKASLHFIIREGYKTKVKRINIYGNVAYPDKKISKVVKTKIKAIYRSGYLNEETLQEDMDRITSFYEQNGFIDAVAKYEVEYLYKGQVNVNVQIDEGKRYSVGEIIIGGNTIVSSLEVSRVMENINEGDVFSREKLTVDLAQIRSLYFDRGYIFANINESTSLDSDTGLVAVKIDIKEGELAYIDKVRIQGNTRTRDIVIRRELRMHPGDRFDGAQLRRSKERLNNLGYFEEVAFDIDDTDYYDRKDLVVQVKEAKTGTFSFGGGFSTVDKVVGFVEIEQRNFDFTNWPTFTGGGQRLQLRAETGSTKNNLLLSFTEPWMFDYPISAGFDLYRTARDREEDVGYAYDEERTGGNIRLGKQFGDRLSMGVSYKFEEVVIENFEDDVSAALLAEAGTNAVSMLGFNASIDHRDSVFSPTKGFSASSSVDFAGGLLGGDKDFYRLQANGSYFIPMTFKSVLEFRLRGGIVDAYGESNSVPIFERFFAGGAKSIRGYEERKVGPQDAVTTDPIGGEALLVANVEYTIPIIDFVKIAAFFDAGNVWADAKDFAAGEFKSGVGMGARVKTPIGPINLDYGYPLNDEEGEDGRTGKFYFSVSRGF